MVEIVAKSAESETRRFGNEIPTEVVRTDILPLKMRDQTFLVSFVWVGDIEPYLLEGEVVGGVEEVEDLSEFVDGSSYMRT